MTEIISTIIAAFSAVAGSYYANSKKTAIIEEKIKELKKDISTLSTRVDKHNNLVERMAIVEQSTKSAHKRIDDIKEG